MQVPRVGDARSILRNWSGTKFQVKAEDRHAFSLWLKSIRDLGFREQSHASRNVFIDKLKERYRKIKGTRMKKDG